MRTRSPLSSIAILAAGLLLAAAPAGARARDEQQARSFEAMAPMRDGVRLAADVHLPAGAGPWPAVVQRTPYNKAGTSARAREYHAHGYAFIAQDQRGRYRSEGVYVPHESGAVDGYDTVEWIAQQPWSNGRVGISGASAVGIAAYLAAAADPPHLLAAYVEVAPESLFSESRFIGGAWKEADTGNWMRGQGVDEAQIEGLRRRVLLDDRWLATDFVFLRHAVDIPIYHVGGWYDVFLQGTLNNFRYLQEWGRPGARGRQKVSIGPFGHGAIRGDLVYPGGGTRSDLAEELRFFDCWLRGIDNGITSEPPVRYYQRAAAQPGAASAKNQWRTAAAWPPPGVLPTRLYLQPAGQLSFRPPAAAASTTSYSFDPAHPVETVGGLNLTLPLGPLDQRAIPDRPDYLRFATAPLEEDVVIAGKLDAELWAATDGPDTDFVVKLVDVYPDGYQALVIDGVLRARYRHGRRAEDVAPMVPGQPALLPIDLWHTAITFERGHRIAVHVTSSNHPRFDVNPNTGVAPGQPGPPPRVARNTVFHEPAHPSAIVLPVLPAAAR